MEQSTFWDGFEKRAFLGAIGKGMGYIAGKAGRAAAATKGAVQRAATSVKAAPGSAKKTFQKGFYSGKGKATGVDPGKLRQQDQGRRLAKSNAAAKAKAKADAINRQQATADRAAPNANKVAPPPSAIPPKETVKDVVKDAPVKRSLARDAALMGAGGAAGAGGAMVATSNKPAAQQPGYY